MILRIGLIQVQLRIQRLSLEELSDAQIRRLLARPERYWADSRERALRYAGSIPRGM